MSKEGKKTKQHHPSSPSSSSSDASTKHQRRGRSRTRRSRRKSFSKDSSPCLLVPNASTTSTNSNASNSTEVHYAHYYTTNTSTSTGTGADIILFIKCILFSIVVTFIVLYTILGYDEEVMMLLQEMKTYTQDCYHHYFINSGSRRYISSFMGAVVSSYSSASSYSSENRITEHDRSSTTKPIIYELNDMHPNCKEKGALSSLSSLPSFDNTNSCTDDQNQNQNDNQNNNNHQNNNNQECRNHQPHNQCRDILTQEMKHIFQEEGVIVIRGLLSPNLFQGLDRSSHSLVNDQWMKKFGTSVSSSSSPPSPPPSSGKQFFMNKMGVAFTNDHHHDNNNNGDHKSDDDQSMLPSSGFRDVALSSLIPQVAAELLGMEYHIDDDGSSSSNNDYDDDDGNGNGNGNTIDNGDSDSDANKISIDENENESENDHDKSKEDTLRMLRDVLLVKDADKFICGWHVDDLGFWPTTASSPGINAWIAIDDMSSAAGGNFAVSVGTHNVPWKEEVYNLTGSTTTLPSEGYKDAKHMFATRKGGGTCNIKNMNRALHDKLEERKRVYDLKAGDIIFMTRWLFHRTIPFDGDLVKEKRKRGELGHLLSRRYSIRYTPGTAELPKGYTTERSILWDEDNQGRTLDSVGTNDGPWYPQCWPHSTSVDEQSEIQELMKNKMPIAETRRKERIDEMKPFLQKIGKQQRAQLNLIARNAGKKQEM